MPLLAITAGCWQPRYFTPRENLSGSGPDGSSAAVYVVDTGDSASSNAEVRVWSQGAEARFTDDDSEVVDLHVGFELENNSQQAIALDVDALTCEELIVDGLLQEPIGPQEVSGSGFAPPGTTTRVDVVFRPPTTIPRSVDAFTVRFAVRSEQDQVLSQATPFAPAARHFNNYYGGAYFGPWGPWGGYRYGYSGFWRPWGFGYYGSGFYGPGCW